MPSFSLARKYRNTCFIFPAFLPLVELLPWFLTMLGALAGGTQLLGKWLWRQRGWRVVAAILSLGLIATGGTLLWQRYGHRPPAAIGSELATSLPRLERFAAPSGRPLPAQAPLTPLWDRKISGQNLSKPLVHDGILFIGTIEGTFNAYDAHSGLPLWSLHKTEPVYTPPAIAANRIFIGEGHHYSLVCALMALSYPDGAPLWSRKFRSHIESYPALDLANNRLWVSGGETGLWALAADNGAVRWHQPLGDMDVPPLYADDTLYAIARQHPDKVGSVLYALAPDSGAINWRVSLNGNHMGSLWRHEKSIYFSTAIGQVGTFSAADTGWAQAVSLDGTLEWETPLPAMTQPEGALSPDGALLFYALKNGTVIALRTRDGHVQWQEKIGAVIQTDLALIGGEFVVAVADDGTVSIRAQKTGKESARLQVQPGNATPLYANGILYITAPERIYAFAGYGAAP